MLVDLPPAILSQWPVEDAHVRHDFAAAGAFE